MAETADKPYQKFLVIGLFSKFSVRNKFELELVRQLSELGADAVASTTMMDRGTPLTRQTFLPMVEKIDADAVLITQVADLNSETSMKDMSPEATYNVGATYYFNVWTVELTEYVEPQAIEVDNSLVLATQLYSVATRELVWAIESKSNIVNTAGQVAYTPIIIDEVDAIAAHLSAEGLVPR